VCSSPAATCTTFCSGGPAAAIRSGDGAAGGAGERASDRAAGAANGASMLKAKIVETNERFMVFLLRNADYLAAGAVREGKPIDVGGDAGQGYPGSAARDKKIMPQVDPC
jgi:hypothetical protein